jgi:hypothetical protein
LGHHGQQVFRVPWFENAEKMTHFITGKAPDIGPDRPGIAGPDQGQDHGKGCARAFLALGHCAEKDEIHTQFPAGL